jgi:hypothetical protein
MESIMAHSTNSTTLLQDFSGRRITAAAIIVAIVGSACLNIYGAAMIFPAWQTAAIFAIVIGANEVIAALSLRHIVRDFENRRPGKAALASIMLALAITGCVISGHKAFHTLFLEADAKHASNAIRADAAQREADAQHADFLRERTDVNRARWQRLQAQADEARLVQMKSEPPPKAIIYVLLVLFELVKIGGLYAIATPSTLGLTGRQKQARRRLEKIKDARAQAEFEKKLAAAIDAEDNVVPLRASN